MNLTEKQWSALLKIATNRDGVSWRDLPRATLASLVRRDFIARTWDNKARLTSTGFAVVEKNN